MCFVNYLMKTLQKILNADITQITKVRMLKLVGGVIGILQFSTSYFRVPRKRK